MVNIKVIILSTAIALCVISCQTTKSVSLYDALGKSPGIAAIVEDFINELLNDKLIQHYFEEADLDRFHDKLVEQICQLSGGPCKYSGKSMSKIHSDFKISEAQFNALVENLMIVMDQHQIAVGAQNRLLALLAPMRKDIMTKEPLATSLITISSEQVKQ
jgi:hemoglobin